jgi:hypothetical protein
MRCTKKAIAMVSTSSAADMQLQTMAVMMQQLLHFMNGRSAFGGGSSLEDTLRTQLLTPAAQPATQRGNLALRGAGASPQASATVRLPASASAAATALVATLPPASASASGSNEARMDEASDDEEVADVDGEEELCGMLSMTTGFKWTKRICEA